MFYLPPGSMMQLIDGRVLHKNQKTNMWHDNMGVPISEQQLHFMMSFPSFSEDPSGGGDSPVVAEAPASDPDPVVSLNAPFDDIVATSSPTFNANRTIITTAPVTLRLTFSSGGIYSSSSLNVYKNDAYLMNIRTSSLPSPRTLTETFANGDQLKFDMNYSSQTLNNFDVTIEKIEPGSVQVVDTFNVSVPAP